ncbi:hypothetical protein C2G38_2175336 [Gigaspora rosea]|uniref:SWIM-type domain-containing protein n=1 Tax=Gigaspora rosea TaxID=44941 RepID=A0A397VS22_9GLOM|nr:hypothetical protein C2G38_2175336 [Gigaspora rosea]
MLLNLFVIVDNHHHSRIVVQSLVQDETISSYKWILPKVIFTDADSAIVSAISQISYKIGFGVVIVIVKQNYHRWEELLIQYPVSKNYLIQLWKSRQLWAKIYVFMTFCAGMQSTQWVEAIQLKLERESQYQRLSEYKNVLPTRGLSSVQNVLIKPIQDEFNKYLTLESALLPNAHEYTEGYLEDEYDALQASLKNIINMVNCENIIEIWKVSLFDQYNNNYPHYVILLTDNSYLCTCLYIISNSFYCRHFFNIFKISRNAKFDIKLISKHWYTESMQASDYSVIMGTAASEFDTYEEMNQDTYEEVNQVISIHGPDTTDSEGHTGVDTTEQTIVDINKIENPKKLKHKGHPKLMGPMQQSVFQDLDTRQNKSRQITETDSEDEDIEDEDGPSRK